MGQQVRAYMMSYKHSSATFLQLFCNHGYTDGCADRCASRWGKDCTSVLMHAATSKSAHMHHSCQTGQRNTFLHTRQIQSGRSLQQHSTTRSSSASEQLPIGQPLVTAAKQVSQDNPCPLICPAANRSAHTPYTASSACTVYVSPDSSICGGLRHVDWETMASNFAKTCT